MNRKRWLGIALSVCLIFGLTVSAMGDNSYLSTKFLRGYTTKDLYNILLETETDITNILDGTSPITGDITITADDSSTPLIMTNIMTTPAKVGCRALFIVQSNVALGSYVNALKGYMEFTGTSGSTSGLASGVCAELKTPNRTLPSGAYYPLEIEHVAGGTSVVSDGSGSRVGFIYMENSIDLAGDFDDNGYLMTIAGLTAGAGKILSAGSQTLRIQAGLRTAETTKYLVLSDTENCIVLGSTATYLLDLNSATGSTADIRLQNGATIANATADAMTITEPTITLAASTQINLDGATDVTGILTIDTAGSPADGILIAATTPTDGLEISSVCGTHAINISAAQTGAGITIASTCGTYGLNIAGVCSTSAINIGASAKGVTITGVTGYAVDIATSGQFRMGIQGIGIPTATATPFAMEIHAETNADAVITAGDTGMSCGIRSRYEISKAQTSTVTWVAVEGRLRPKAAIAGGIVCGVQGGVEADAVAFTGIASTMITGGHFYLEMADGASIASGHVSGVTIDSSVHGNVSMANCVFSGLRIKISSGKEVWENGIIIEDSAAVIGVNIGACATGLDFTGACTTAAISMDSATFADGDHEIEMRNNVAGDKSVICSGDATDDTGIIQDVGADADIADGSLYMSCTDGAGVLFIKKNDVWTAFTNP